MKLADIFLAIGADDSGLDSDLKRSENRTLNWVGGLAKATAVAVGAAVVGAGALVVDSVSKYMDFDKGMKEVFTLLPGLSEQAYDKMKKDVLSWSAELGAATTKSIPALYQAISAGVPPENVFDFLTVAQKAAVGGVTELETAVDGISSVVNAYGSEVISAAEASDLMFTAVRLGKTDFTQLSQSLFNVIPTASAVGVGFGDVTAGLAAMTAQGTPTSVATTQLRQMLVELSKDGSKAAAEFEKISGQSFPEFIATGGNTADALALIEQNAVDSGKSVADFFGSVEAGNAALALTGTGAETYRRNLEEMAASAGATDQAFATMEKSSARTWDRIKAKVESAKLTFTDKFEPALAAGFSQLEKYSESLTMLADGDLKGAISNIFGDEAAANAMTFFGQVQGFFDNTITPGISLLREAGGAFLEMFGPGILESVTGIGDSFGRLFGGLYEKAQPVIKEVFEKVSAWLIENGPLIESFAATVASQFDLLVSIILGAVDIISPLISGLVDVLLGMVTLFMQIVTGDFAGAWETMKTIAITVVQAIGDTLMNLFNAVPTWFGSSMDETIATWQSNFKQLQDIATKVMEIIGGQVTKQIDKAREAFGAITGAIKELVGWFKKLAQAAASFALPYPIDPHSPTPFEIGLRGINDAVGELTRTGFPKLNNAFPDAAAALAPVAAGDGAVVPSAPLEVHNHYNINSHLDIYEVASLVAEEIQRRRSNA
jgi:TP901 family phage tail tape measure protein